jgi:hypothetical protein
MAKRRVFGFNMVSIEIPEPGREVKVDQAGVVENMSPSRQHGRPLPTSDMGAKSNLFGLVPIQKKFIFEGKTWKKMTETVAKVETGRQGRPQLRKFDEYDEVMPVP